MLTQPAATPMPGAGTHARVISVLLLISLALVSPASAERPLTVESTAGRLTVAAERTARSEILREVARRTGLEIRGAQELHEKVSVRFSELLLGEGLGKLLATSPRGGARPVLALVFGRPGTRPPPETISENAVTVGSEAT